MSKFEARIRLDNLGVLDPLQLMRLNVLNSDFQYITLSLFHPQFLTIRVPLAIAIFQFPLNLWPLIGACSTHPNHDTMVHF